MLEVLRVSGWRFYGFREMRVSWFEGLGFRGPSRGKMFC